MAGCADANMQLNNLNIKHTHTHIHTGHFRNSHTYTVHYSVLYTYLFHQQNENVLRNDDVLFCCLVQLDLTGQTGFRQCFIFEFLNVMHEYE